MNTRWPVFLLTLCSHAIAAPPLGAHDFAAGLPLSTPGRAAFYRLTLPAAVYQGAAHADLRDLRVFNGAGEPVPYALLAPAPEQHSEAIELRPFILPATVPSASAAQVHIDGGGLSLQWQPGAPAQGSTVLLAWPEPQPTAELSELDLQWSDSGWQQSASVAASDDLQHWQQLVSDVPLLDVVHGSDHLRQGQLRFAPTQARYWRISLPPGHLPALTAVRGLALLPQTANPWVWLAPAHIINSGPWQRVLQFDSPQQITMLEVRLPQPNSVVPLRVEARFNATGPWQSIGSAVLSRTQQGQGEQLREHMPIDLGAVRELRISADPAQGGWGSGEPGFLLARPAAQLVFNARGAGPYLLAYGAARAGFSALDIDSLLGEAGAPAVAELPSAIAGNETMLGGWPQRTAADPQLAQAHWHTVVLWAVLIATTALLAGLAIKLAREQPRV